MPVFRLRPTRARAATRRGFALVLVVLLTTAVSATVSSAVYLTASSRLIAKSIDRERDLRYAAEAALMMGKSRLWNSRSVLPDTGVNVMETDITIPDASNVPLPGITATITVGKTGNLTGQFGLFATVVADVRGPGGTRMVRALEFYDQPFSLYAQYANNSNLLNYGPQVTINGPVWGNQSIQFTGARVNGSVTAVGTVSGGVYSGTRLITEGAVALPMPTATDLSRLTTYATDGGMMFTGKGTNVAPETRIEFVAVDLNNDGDSTDVDEGFFKVYNSGPSPSPLASSWVMGKIQNTNCGVWLPEVSGGVASLTRSRFFTVESILAASTVTKPSAAAGIQTVPIGANNTASRGFLQSTRFGTEDLTIPQTALPADWNGWQTGATGTLARPYPGNVMNSAQHIAQHPNYRCYPGGSNALSLSQRSSLAAYTDRARREPGNDTTFSAIDRNGRWTLWPGTPDARVVARRPDAGYLFPISTALNPAFRGVIQVHGPVAISGVVRGKVTLYVTGRAQMVQSIRYANGDANPQCADVLGLITGENMMLSTALDLIPTAQSNNPNGNSYPATWTQAPVTTAALGSANQAKMPNPGGGLTLHGILMTQSLLVDNPSFGGNTSTCQSTVKRGCFNLIGGLIENTPTDLMPAYGRQQTYDRCMETNTPPQFPTTARFQENRYFELDPSNLSVAAWFAANRAG